ncbi:hypothetical protein DPMN_184248, partial [Dreissena polymorpha]
MECEWFKTMGIVFGITLFTSYAVAQRVVLTGDGMPPNGSTVPAGSALTLTCSCSQNANNVAFWQKSLTDVSPIRRMRMFIDNTGICVKYPSNPSWLSSCTCVNQEVYTCTVERIEIANNKDVWTCHCTFAAFFAVSNALTIEIAVGITGVSLSPLPPVRIIAQNEGNIICTTTEGIPAAMVHWFRETSNGVSNITSLSSATSTQYANGSFVVVSTLVVRPLREDNLMRVYCNASNMGTWYRSNIGIIEALYPPSKPQFRISSTAVSGTVKIIEGESYTFHCESDSNPVATYIWSHRRGQTYHHHSSLSLTKPAAAYDEGEYVCRAENTLTPTGGQAHTQSNNSSLIVNILYGPQISAISSRDVIRGNTFQQTCLFTPGNPVNTMFRWTRSSGTESWAVQTEHTLLINSVQRTDDSDYTCEVSNLLNPTVGTSIIKKDNGSFHLNVLFGAEKLQLIVIGYVGKRNVIVNEGEEHTFKCLLESNPGSTMVIKKDGTEVVRALNSRIVEYTNRSSCEAAGWYTCSGSNDHGAADADSVQYFVKCSARPSPFVDINYNVSSLQAVNTTLSFYTQAYPDPQYTWQRCTYACVNITDGTDYNITSNGLISNLTILNVEKQDYGSYKVIAHNGIGAAWQELFQLIPYDDPPRANAGPDRTVQLPEEYVIISGDGSKDDIGIVKYEWSQISGPAVQVNLTNDPRLTLRDLQPGTYVLELTVTDMLGQEDTDNVTLVVVAQDAPPVANAGADQTIQLPDNSVNLDGSRSTDDVRIITYRWRLTSGDDRDVRLTGDRTPRLNVNGLKQGEYVFTLTVEDGKEQLSTDDVRIIVQPSDAPPVANAGPDQTIRLPNNNVILDGSRSTDDVRIITYRWRLTSGDDRGVRLTGDRTPRLNVNGLKEGEYVFQLTVEDGKEQLSNDEVRVVVQAVPDAPPVANAGPDQTLQLPTNRAILDGTRSADDVRIVTYSWKLKSGDDSGVRMTGDRTPRLSVEGLKEGEYVFTLTVSDGKEQLSTDEARIVVQAEPNAPPVANAGPDQTIRLPVDNVVLDGSKSTDDKRIVTYRWKLTTGDSRGVRLTGDRTPRLSVAGLKEGEYVFQLEVSDQNELLDYDEARVVVQRAPRVTGYDVIFVLDSSVTPEHFRWMINYTRDSIRQMNIDDEEFRVGYLIYSNTGYKQFDLKDHLTKADVQAAVNRVVYRPGTKNTATALKHVRTKMFTPENGDRDFAKNYIIHLTGNGTSDDPFEAATEACTIQAQGVGMFGVGFGDVRNRDELDAQSSVPTSDWALTIRNEAAIGETPGLMLYGIKNRTPRPSQCPEKATHAPSECSTNTMADIVFMVDGSGSVSDSGFQSAKAFMSRFVDHFNIGPSHTQIGVMIFGTEITFPILLNSYSDATALKNAIYGISFPSAGTENTTAALVQLMSTMFIETNGKRSNATQIAIIVTD